MVRIVGVGKQVDVAVPAGGGHRDLEVIEQRAAADHRFAARIIGRRHHPMRVEKQVDGAAGSHPSPGLTVVQRWSAACQLDSPGNHLGVNHRLGHRTHLPPIFDHRASEHPTQGPLAPAATT
ncbi:hypothetical protein MPS_1301 [Mycobacterium pseudoshottsii JCM 15466]|nr:hypothetical protein MPS_1301 [Mycobacterium pseudoshottsii JCM 15466]